MANLEQVNIIKNLGVDFWNKSLTEVSEDDVMLGWEKYKNSHNSRIDLTKADLSGLDLSGINFFNADLTQANLENTKLDNACFMFARMQGSNLKESRGKNTTFSRADLSFSELRDAHFYNCDFQSTSLWSAKCSGTIFTGSNLKGCDLTDAYLFSTQLENVNLTRANLYHAEITLCKMKGANLSRVILDKALLHQTSLNESNLTFASLIKTDIYNCSIDDSIIYGISVWDVKLGELSQKRLKILPEGESQITTDSIEIAQFIHLLIKREKLGGFITNISSKLVLILGRFNEDSLEILNALGDEIRKYDLIPIIFDFIPSRKRDYTETIKILAGLSSFIVADLSNPKSIPLELQSIVPNYQIPVVPIINDNQEPFSMFVDLTNKYNWVLSVAKYKNIEDIRKKFKSVILDRALNKQNELLELKYKNLKSTNFKDF